MATFGPEVFALKNGKTVLLRHVSALDGAAFPAFQQQAARETQFTLQVVSRVPDPLKAAEAYAKSEADPLDLRVGVFEGDRLVGIIGFHPEDASHPWTRHVGHFGMMVLKDYWGQGVARRLLEIVHAHAAANGFSRIEALVRVPNERGLRLYKSLGYEIEGLRKSAALIEGGFVDEYYIARLIPPAVGPVHWTPPVLSTERLILRPLTQDDAASIFEYARNPNVSRFTLWEPHESVRDSQAYIREYAGAYYREGVPEPLGIRLSSEPDRVMGTVGCFWESKQSKSMELAYALAEPLWGQGLVVEASRALLEYVFREFAPNRVQARCKLENAPSARVMEKLGMRREGVLRSSLVHRGREWDMACFSVLKGEWKVGS